MKKYTNISAILTFIILSAFFIFINLNIQIQRTAFGYSIIILLLSIAALAVCDNKAIIYNERTPQTKNMHLNYPAIAITFLIYGYLTNLTNFDKFKEVYQIAGTLCIANLASIYFFRNDVKNYDKTISSIVLSTITVTTITIITGIVTRNIDLLTLSILIQTYAQQTLLCKIFPIKEYKSSESAKQSQVISSLLKIALLQTIPLFLVLITTEISKYTAAVITVGYYRPIFIYLSIIMLGLSCQLGTKPES